MRIQYRTRRIAEDLLLAPTAGQTLIKNRDGHPYLIDGPRTELVTRIHPPLPKPAGMGNGLYHDADRPNTTWACDRDGLKRLDTAPASPLEKDGPWRRIATRIAGFRLTMP